MRQRRIARMPWLGQAMLLRKTPIAFIDGEPIYPIFGSDGEGNSGGENDDKDAGGSGSGADDDADDEGDSKEEPPTNPKEYKAWLKNQELSRENASRRRKNRELLDALEARDKELEAIRQKDLTELQKAQTAATKAEKTILELTARLRDQQVELAFLKLPREKYDWESPAAALTLLIAEHGSDLELSDDGSVEGLDKAVKALASKHKFLLKQPAASKNGSTGGNFSGDSGGAQKEDAAKRFRF